MKNKLYLILSIILIIVISVVLYSCKRKPKTAEENFDLLKTIKSYSTDAIFSYKNSRGETTEKCKQYYDSTKGYRLEIGEDRIQIYKDKKIFVQDLKNNAKYTLEKDFDELYKYTFIGEYINLMYTSEDIKYFCKKIEGKNYAVVELFIPGNNKNIAKAALFINQDNNLPDKLIVYDDRGNERLQVIYEGFKVEDELDKNLFM